MDGSKIVYITSPRVLTFQRDNKENPEEHFKNMGYFFVASKEETKRLFNFQCVRDAGALLLLLWHAVTVTLKIIIQSGGITRFK